jgi:hypothetical protein
MSRGYAGRGGKRTSRNRSRIEQFDFAQTFLIVCEGERTEPNYFRAFRVAGNVRNIRVEGEGYNTLSLVKWAIELAVEGEYDQVWCVFDRDSFSPESFNAAQALASQHGLHGTYSNEAFELWYLLHFHFYNTGISRASYCERLGKLLGRNYQKNDLDIYRQLLPHQATAIRNARNLLAHYAPRNPAYDNPSTTVFELVEQMNRYAPENLRRISKPENTP